MRVLTFSWDFPPSRNGGLGVACYGLTRALEAEGVEVTLVLPRKQALSPTKAKVIFAFPGDAYRIFTEGNYPRPYQGTDTMIRYLYSRDVSGKPIYRSHSLMDEAHRFAHEAARIASTEDFDLIHAHDWTSFLAGIAAKKASGKPLILHVHATSFDQAGGENVDPGILQIEKEAFAFADQIIVVSDYTKGILMKKLKVPEEKIATVHNGCDVHDPKRHEPALQALKAQNKKIVLYHGRITIQKGVDYFVKAARKVVDTDPNVVFVISGWGDMTNQIINMVGQFGLSQHVIFAGSLWDEDRDRMYQTADLVVMPSVSEPFGLVPLEALQHGTASLISRQSGVGEVLKHVLKVDFWDIDDMANKILAALRYPVMREQMVKEGKLDLLRLSWREMAKKIYRLYKTLLQYVTT